MKRAFTFGIVGLELLALGTGCSGTVENLPIPPAPSPEVAKSPVEEQPAPQESGTPIAVPTDTPVTPPTGTEHPRADLFGKWSGKGTVDGSTLDSFDLTIAYVNGKLDFWFSWTSGGNYHSSQSQMKLVGNDLRDYFDDKLGELSPLGLNFKYENPFGKTEVVLTWTSSTEKKADLAMTLVDSGRTNSFKVTLEQWQAGTPPPALTESSRGDQ